MRTGRPRRQGRLTSLSAEAAANRDTHPHERLRSRFFGHRVQCEARVVVRVFFTPRALLRSREFSPPAPAAK